jgi:GNAT superfamily N-acetyltransferase
MWIVLANFKFRTHIVRNAIYRGGMTNRDAGGNRHAQAPMRSTSSQRDRTVPHEEGGSMSDYTVKPLGPNTWDAFVRLAERHNGVWGGCWCTWFHMFIPERKKISEDGRTFKERLVREGRAHAALVFDGDAAVAWCQYGSPAELPNIYHRKQYEADLVRLPDYRLTCFFVDRDYRRKGVAAVALDGALGLIAKTGGGVVEGYPHDTDGTKVSASFLYNGTRSLFEAAGFSYDRPKGSKNCVMVKTVPPS